jgi:hypothetical protein
MAPLAPLPSYRGWALWLGFEGVLWRGQAMDPSAPDRIACVITGPDSEAVFRRLREFVDQKLGGPRPRRDRREIPAARAKDRP